jgi:hypothetical protein
MDKFEKMMLLNKKLKTNLEQSHADSDKSKVENLIRKKRAEVL